MHRGKTIAPKKTKNRIVILFDSQFISFCYFPSQARAVSQKWSELREDSSLHLFAVWTRASDVHRPPVRRVGDLHSRHENRQKVPDRMAPPGLADEDGDHHEADRKIELHFQRAMTW